MESDKLACYMFLGSIFGFDPAQTTINFEIFWSN